MKAIIIGTPGKGKTTLCNMIKQDYLSIATISLGGLRNPLGIHQPHMGHETEIAPENISFFKSIIEGAMSFHKDYIVEGYGLSPEDALQIGDNHKCPVVLLCHKNTSAKEDFEFVRKYDSKNKWTARRDDDYLRKLYEFYKIVKTKWISCMPENMVFSTDGNFKLALRNAYHYIRSNQM